MPPLVGIGGGRPANGPRASQLGFICDGAWAILQGSRYEAVFERTGRDVRDASTGRPITLRRTSPDQWEILDDLNNVILEISARTDGGLFIRDELGDSYILYTDTLPDDVDSLGELLAEFPTP